MDFKKMRSITAAINRHGARLHYGKGRFLAKALDQWDSATKSAPLPAVDTSEQDKRREEVEAKQPKPTTKGSFMDSQKRKRGPVATGKHGRPLSPNRWNIKHADGKVWSYEVKEDGRLVIRPPSQFDTPTYTEQQWQAMHEGINAHIEQRKQPAKADEEGKQMEKSEKTQRLEQLIQQARRTPDKLTAGTLQAVNNYLQRQGQPLVTPPAPKQSPWGTTRTLADIAAANQHAIAQTPRQEPTKQLPVDWNLSRMSTQQIQEHRLDQARQQEAKQKEQGKAPLVGTYML